MPIAEEVMAANDEMLHPMPAEAAQIPSAAHPQDVLDSLRRAQAAFSDCLGRYLEL